MLDPKNVKPGEEQYEYFTDRVTKKRRCQYDYRDDDGELFSCVRMTVEDCRRARNIWLDSR
jgi:hypothetical protein